MIISQGHSVYCTLKRIKHFLTKCVVRALRDAISNVANARKRNEIVNNGYVNMRCLLLIKIFTASCLTASSSILLRKAYIYMYIYICVRIKTLLRFCNSPFLGASSQDKYKRGIQRNG